MRINKLILLVGLLCFLYSCNIQGVKTKKDTSEDILISENGMLSPGDSTLSTDGTTTENPKDTLRLDNGIIITYYTKGQGQKLEKGDMIKLAYRVRLSDGTFIDGNNKIKQPYIPFLVGWNQQTKGWDIALQHLRPGANVDVFIPSNLARGEEGIKDLIPPNSDILLSLRVLDLFRPIVKVEGLKIWKYDELEHPGDSIQDGDEIYLNYWASSESNPRYDSNYKRGEVYRMVMGDPSVLPGLEKALKYGREGDRLMILIPAKMAYGKEGLYGLVKPKEDIFYDIQIAKVITKPSAIDLE